MFMCSRSFVYCIFIARWFAQHQPQYLRFALGWRKRNNIFAISISLISSAVILIDFIFLAFQAFYPINLSALQFILFLVFVVRLSVKGPAKKLFINTSEPKICMIKYPNLSTSDQCCFNVMDQRWNILMRRWKWNKIQLRIFNVAQFW